MSKVQMVIKNGNAYVDGRFQDADIIVNDGKIVAIVKPGEELPEAETVYDAEGKHILPGLIDTHVHMREPGFTHKED
ncbi:MAG: hypothetical protein IKD97_05665, partial [Firmicutes bacterium]|nr:hypothetical protein [Bacillota bacterium]